MNENDEPDCMIVTGQETYLVRFKVEGGIDTVDTKEVTLPGAVNWADANGYEPTHWAGRNGFPALIPTGIVRRHRASSPTP